VIVAFSTSSPQASVALISAYGAVIGSARELAPQGASGACMRLLENLLAESGRKLADAELFAADLGPGSFTGVKVAVTLAKTLAFACGTSAAGASSFDLVSADGRVVLPSKRGEFFVRDPGAEPFLTGSLPDGEFVGYGAGIESPTYPDAERFAPIVAQLKALQPEMLVPNYMIEPSISIPKKPYAAPGSLG
jgi:tRNA threonylcarbamoyladenosine biosynthesis protein TsaB